MKTQLSTKECSFLGRNFRFTYNFGSGVLEIDELECVGWLFKQWKYKRIFFGHSDAIEAALKFYNEQRLTDEFLTSKPTDL